VFYSGISQLTVLRPYRFRDRREKVCRFATQSGAAAITNEGLSLTLLPDHEISTRLPDFARRLPDMNALARIVMIGRWGKFK
jgi:hypothetical protein